MIPIVRHFFLLAVICFYCSYSVRSQGVLSDSNPYQLPITQTKDSYLQKVSENPQMQMIDLGKSIKGIVLDIRYATTNNFTGEIIYAAPKAFVRRLVAEAVQKIQDSLLYYRLSLKIYDAYRPYAATLKFFKVYPDTSFVANPRQGSRHNRGCAIDVTLVERVTEKEIPMPTAFDDFSIKANPEYANLPDTVIANRKFLFGIMAYFGFKPIASEWWHFDFNGWENYPLMDLTFEELERAGEK